MSRVSSLWGNNSMKEIFNDVQAGVECEVEMRTVKVMDYRVDGAKHER